MIAGLASVVTTTRTLTAARVAHRPRGGLGFGQRQQGCAERRGVLGRAPSADPGTPGPVETDGELAAQVGGSFLPVELALRTAFLTVGVNPREQVPGDLLEVGDIEGLGLAQQSLETVGSQLGVAGQIIDATLR